MAIYIKDNKFNWRPVKGHNLTKHTTCSRCNNEVDFFLAWDGNSLGIGGISLFTLNKIYVYKCPICPNYEEISQQYAKALMQGG